MAATTAFGATSLALVPATTSVTTLDFGASIVANTGGGAAAGTYNMVTAASTAANALSDAVYAVHVPTSVTGGLKLSVDSYTPNASVTAPAHNYMYYSELATGGTAGPTNSATTVAGPWVQMADAPAVGGTAVTANLTVSGGVSTKDIFLAPSAPGTYMLHFVDPGTQAGSDDDIVSPTITLNVLDVKNGSNAFTTTAGTTPTADDWNPVLTNSATSAGIGAPVSATLPLGGLTLTDARGSSAGTGVLAAKLAALTGIAFSGPAGLSGTSTGATSSTAAATSISKTVPVGETSAAGTLVSTGKWDYEGTGLGATIATVGTTASTDVATNHVSAVALAATDAVGTVKYTDTVADTVAVKTGTAAVTYTATVTDSDTDKSGDVVYFTLSGTDVASLTTNGTTVSAASHIFSAVTDTNGVASLTVTDGAATPNTYSVSASSNSVISDNDSGTGGNQALPATYAAAAASSFVSLNSTTELTPDVGGSVTLKGKLVDQFGAAFQPALAATQVATVTVGGTAYYPVIAAGLFSYSYTPATNATAGSSTAYTFDYGAATQYASNIHWASTATPASITVSAPAANATGVNLSDSGAGALNGLQPITVSGTIYDAASAAIAYKGVTLTGGDGVYFSDVNTGVGLTKTLALVSTSGGAFTGYAYFTKPGTLKVTATSGAVVKDTSVTTDATADPFTVAVNNAKGAPGSTLVVTGLVTDMFGNPVPSTLVDLSTGTSTIGALGASQVTTNSEGVFSTTYVAGSNQSGTATLTATLHSQVANLVADSTWALVTGVTTPTGKYTSTGTITVGSTALTLVAPVKNIGGAATTLTGTAPADASVDIYARTSGVTSPYLLIDNVTAGSDGTWTDTITQSWSQQFLAKSGTMTSASATTLVYSTVTVTSRALGKGWLQVTERGKPDVAGVAVFVRVLNGKNVVIGRVRTNAAGDASIKWKAKPGTYLIKVYYQAPGTVTGITPVTRAVVK